jgi:DNA polymerase IV
MRSVLFVDPPAFCTSLEGLVAPALRTRPLAVAPPGTDRATILALSAEARLAGLERGMPVRKAQRLCPDLIVLPPNPRLYARASRALHEILRIYAPAIEPRGYGHAFLDLTGTGRLFGPPQDVAARIQRETSERLGFSVSVGVASNKLVSQAAIRADRRTGGRTGWWTGRQRGYESLYVPAGDERGFLAPHPLEVLPELGTSMRARLEDYQLDLIGEVAAIPESALCAVFGREGRTLRARAQGIDPRPVLPPERQAEFHVAHALTTDTNDIGVLHPLLRLLSERLGRRLRQRGLTAGRLRVEATYADYTAGARAVPLRAAMLDAELWDAARRAFVLANTKRLAVRAVALTLDRLMEAEAQLELWGGSGAAGQRGSYSTEQSNSARDFSLVCSCGPAAHLPRCPTALQSALDRIHSRYGTQAVVHSTAVASYRRTAALHHSTTIFPKVAFPSMTRCASAS